LKLTILMKKKIKLNDLKVNSFVTSVELDSLNDLKGGTGSAVSNDGAAFCFDTNGLIICANSTGGGIGGGGGGDEDC